MMNQYEKLKRQMYMIILPIIVIASIMGLLLSSYSNPMNTFMLSIFIIVFTFSFILLFFPNTLQIVEYLNLTVISLLLLVKFYNIVTFDMIELQHPHTGSFTYWTPLILVFIFISLSKKAGLIYAFLIWICLVVIGSIHLHDIPAVGVERLLQFYLSNFVYIIFIFFVRNVITYYTEKEMVEKLAYYDTLTGVANRRKIYLWLDECVKKKQIFSVILFDIDYFKSINDTFGHAIGDSVLKEITDVVISQLEHSDNMGRWGGEEFIIVSRRRREDTAILANKIRKAIEDHTFETAGTITASFGVSIYENQPMPLLLEQADHALYQAKQNGRNRVEISP
jgi:diguanylate cyclase (GGDEF)-like protein